MKQATIDALKDLCEELSERPDAGGVCTAAAKLREVLREEESDEDVASEKYD